MSILIKTVRIAGFRGLQNIEVNLEKTTILTGMNNTGKTSFLKALQIALGRRQFITQEDFFDDGNNASEKIIIDVLIIPIDDNGKQIKKFNDEWSETFTTERMKFITDTEELLTDNACVPLRTIAEFNPLKNDFLIEHYILQQWLTRNENWVDTAHIKKNSYFDAMPFFYLDAQRDILEDIKLKNSYLGKMLSKIQYDENEITKIEEQIKKINDEVVKSSDVLKTIKDVLGGLDSAVGKNTGSVEITPLTKKLKDLNKGLNIYYTEDKSSFPLEAHGMGTRSWSALLMLKAFILSYDKVAKKGNLVFFPVITIEEPESHLHPNAQKKLYKQMDEMTGQKIISTHSAYIAASAELKQIRSFSKIDGINCGKIDLESFDNEEIRKIERQVINTRGELFFSKMLVLFEGETEEQVLPILAKKYFNENNRIDYMDIDFVGVSGYGNYQPFAIFAQQLYIPYLIFSDAEENVKLNIQRNNNDNNVIFLNDGNDFEKQLIEDGFRDEIIEAIISLECDNENHRNPKREELKNLSNDELRNKIPKKKKTQYAPAIAEAIVASDKKITGKILELFQKIETIMNQGKIDGS